MVVITQRVQALVSAMRTSPLASVDSGILCVRLHSRRAG